MNSQLRSMTGENSINENNKRPHEEKQNVSASCYRPPLKLFKPWLNHHLNLSQLPQNSFNSSKHRSISPKEMSNASIGSEIVSRDANDIFRYRGLLHDFDIQRNQEEPPSKAFYSQPRQTSTPFSQVGPNVTRETWTGNTFSLCPPSSNKRIFSCPYCRYLTDRKNNLKRHVVTMHRKCDRKLECCGLVFNSKAALRDHVIVFHNAGYSCHYCGRNFCRKALLKRHLAVHSGRKDYSCEHCDYATSHKSNLDRHKKIHERPERAHEIFDDLTGSLSRTSASSVGNVKEASQKTHSSTSELSTCSSSDVDVEDSVSLRKEMDLSISSQKNIEQDTFPHLKTEARNLSPFNSHSVPAKVPQTQPTDPLNIIRIPAHLSPIARLSNFPPAFHFQSPSFYFQRTSNYFRPALTFAWSNTSGHHSFHGSPNSTRPSNQIIEHLPNHNKNGINSEVINNVLNTENIKSTNSSLENIEVRDNGQSRHILTKDRHQNDGEFEDAKPCSLTGISTLLNDHKLSSTVLENRNTDRHGLPSLNTSVSNIFRLVDVISSDWEKTKLLRKLKKQSGSPDSDLPHLQGNIHIGINTDRPAKC